MSYKQRNLGSFFHASFRHRSEGSGHDNRNSQEKSQSQHVRLLRWKTHYCGCQRVSQSYFKTVHRAMAMKTQNISTRHINIKTVEQVLDLPCSYVQTKDHGWKTDAYGWVSHSLILQQIFFSHTIHRKRNILGIIRRMNMMHTNIANDSRKPCLMYLYDIKNKVNKLSDKAAIK